MSTGFRVFLLILFGCGAVYAYRYRVQDISHWLRAEPPDPAGSAARDAWRSPVDGVLDADVSSARLLGEALRRRPEAQRGGGARQEASTEDLPDEVVAEANDLPGAEVAAEEPPSGDEAAALELVDLQDPAGGAQEPPAPGPDADPASITGFSVLTYTVEAGDSLWKISAKVLGDGSRYHEIREANPEVFGGHDADHLQVGATLKIRVPAREESLKVPAPNADTPNKVNSSSGRRPEKPPTRRHPSRGDG